MTRRGLPLLAVVAMLAALSAACLEIRSGDPPMCKVTADCDAGEICEENVCWGNPPAMSFAAVVSPPSERSADLVPREVVALGVTGDGWLDDMHLDTAVAFQGRLQALCEIPCDGRMDGATVTVTRPSAFPGGPGFRRLTEVENDKSFELKVPATRPGDPPFTITVVPAGRDAPGAGSSSLAQVVPPLQVQLAIPASITGHVLELGGIALPRITGTVTTGGGSGLGGYRVVALGRWAPDQPLTEVSSVDFTGSDGLFSIRLSRGLVGAVELVARPVGLPLRPTLHLPGLPADQSSLGRVLALPGGIPGETSVEVRVDHQDTGGAIAPVAGARVVITGGVTANGTAARYSAEATTTEAGVARLRLLDDPTLVPSYRLSITPPAGSKAAAVFDRPYQVQPATTQRLATRFAVTGEVRGADDRPLANVAVTARPSVRFLWSLEPAPQAFLGEVPAATAVTAPDGKFVLFVDHALPNGSGSQAATVWGHYDLSFEPTAKSLMPSWTRADVELPRVATQSSLALGAVHLPDAAYVRGVVFDAENARVEGAEVKLFEVQINPDLCLETRFEPLSCPIPPLLLGRATSAKDGVARLTVPRP
jgi:hypothetical protein